MKRVALFLLVCAVSVFLGCGQNASKEQTADEIVANVTKACGGEETLSKINDQVTTWDFTMEMMPPVAQQGETGAEQMEGEQEVSQEMEQMAESMEEQHEGEALMHPMPMKITYKRPDMLRMDTFGPSGKPVYTQSYDGQTGWIMTMGQTMPMSEAQLQEFKMMAATWIDGLQYYKNHNLQMEKLPNETVDGKELIVLQGTDSYNNVQKFYIDPETYHIMRQSGEMVNAQGESEPMTMVFQDYEMLDNIAYPRSVTQYNQNNEKIWEATLKQSEINTAIANDFFFQTSEMTNK